jgi:hypothetical protein
MKVSPKAPFTSKLVDAAQMLTKDWQQFVSNIVNALSYIGQEDEFDLANNQALAASITPLKFDYRDVSQVTVEYFIQRVASGSESNEDGAFRLRYNKRANTWTLSNGPSSSGITLTVTASGQVQYTSTNIVGTTISRICFRTRAIKAKHNAYSRLS